MPGHFCLSLGTSAATKVFTICPLELDVQLIDTALEKHAPRTSNKGCLLSEWSEFIYLVYQMKRQW